MGRPKLAVGGHCNRGHLLGIGDIIANACYQTCRLCVNQQRREVTHYPYRTTTHYRCGHPKTADNTTGAGHCRTCHNQQRLMAWRQQTKWDERHAALKARNDQILTAWLAGQPLREIAEAYSVSRQSIHQIIGRAGGVTIRALRADLECLAATRCAVVAYDRPD